MKLILLGGGLDSTALIIKTRKENPREKIYGLFINYGQKAVRGERKSSKYFCSKYNIVFKEIRVELEKIANSPLLNKKMAVKHKKNYLVARNLLFLTLATIYANTIGADEILVAFHKEPKNAPFPDATDKFRKEFNKLQKLISKPIPVRAPFRYMLRKEILLMGYKLDSEILTKSFTCYESKTTKECGKCTHCKQKKVMMEWLKKQLI